MRRRIIIVLGIYTVIFFAGVMYVLRMINDATTKLDNLIMLHQVEILREHYLIQIGAVQADLALKDSRHAPSFEEYVTGGLRMGSVVGACFECHHEGPTAARIRDLQRQTDRYKEAISRVLTLRANSQRLSEEEDAAFYIGEELMRKVSDMIAITGSRLEASTQRALREIERTKYVLFALIGATPLVSVGLAFVLLSGLTRPLNTLVASTRRLKTGDLDHRVERLKYEFGELGDAFNDMAASLKEHMHRMQRAEHMAVLGTLSAGLAHEIKNPLAGIKAAMEVLGAEERLSTDDREVLRRVGCEVTRLETLMKSFLNFAKPPKPQLTEIEVDSVVEMTLAFQERGERMKPDAPNRVIVRRELGAPPRTLADPMQLQQVLLNLVLNAVDAMPSGGALTIRTAHEKNPDTIVIEVADTGKGVDPTQAAKLFEPFFTTKPKGTGLGLAICRQLVEQHGGTITCGLNPGGGARFTIRLPRQTNSEGVHA